MLQFDIGRLTDLVLYGRRSQGLRPLFKTVELESGFVREVKDGRTRSVEKLLEIDIGRTRPSITGDFVRDFKRVRPHGVILGV